MSEPSLHNEWAWSQIEAMADGSLRGASRARMRSAMHADPALRRAVAAAEALLRELRTTTRPATPGTLLRRLLDIPGGAIAGSRWFGSPATAALGLAVAAAVVAAVVIVAIRPLTHEPADLRAAIYEFGIAMKYMQKSAVITGEHVEDAVSDGVRDALIMSRESVRDRNIHPDTGG